jgi:WD40 repeat protein|tara:strand:- start:699 stop:1073 length:375 start_codon:yes stop_codon:yes gene_type:complete
MEGGYLIGRRGVYGKIGAASTILSIAFHPDGSTLTGTQSGTIYQWAVGGEQCLQKYEALHQGPVHDIFVNDEYVVTGGKDGKGSCCLFLSQIQANCFISQLVTICPYIAKYNTETLFYNRKSTS